jgi:2-dehydro-3-deoxygluconokinase
MSEQPFVVCLGELMLRLKSPGFERLLQSPLLEASFGGAEANVATGLSIFGIKTRFVSAFPANSIGQAAISFLAQFGVDTSCIVKRDGRMGIYFIETGSGPRGSQVLYDRAGAVIAAIMPDAFDWDAIFAGARWFHVTGITPALSQSAADLAITAARLAKEKGLVVSCDLNYRAKLWKYGRPAPEVMRELIPFVDVIIANEEDIQMSLGITSDQAIGGELDAGKYDALAKQVIDEFPNVTTVAITLRESVSADNNTWSGACATKDESGEVTFYTSRKHALTDIVDRVGAGDAFGTGLIYAMLNDLTPKDALEFAVAASALKHTVPGDINRVTLDEVKKLAAGEGSGRVSR